MHCSRNLISFLCFVHGNAQRDYCKQQLSGLFYAVSQLMNNFLQNYLKFIKLVGSFCCVFLNIICIILKMFNARKKFIEKYSFLTVTICSNSLENHMVSVSDNLTKRSCFSNFNKLFLMMNFFYLYHSM